uniref:hypothetical protein n=1 Tax=Burkholderia sp. AU33423 TaxID=2015355 RepID=UPI001C530781|nr:hypothetical protein [Burkholderia sp. AU33423]
MTNVFRRALRRDDRGGTGKKLDGDRRDVLVSRLAFRFCGKIRARQPGIVPVDELSGLAYPSVDRNSIELVAIRVGVAQGMKCFEHLVERA